jgi:UDP-glucose 4-epimerase
LKYYACDIRDRKQISNIFSKEKPQACIHLTAKTSTRESMKNPVDTIEVNAKGTLNVLSVCTNYKVENFILASSAAV